MALPHAVTTGPCLMRPYSSQFWLWIFFRTNYADNFTSLFVLTSGEKQVVRVISSIKKFEI